ncbi:DUF5131 family protein [Lichenicola cladoniae]
MDERNHPIDVVARLIGFAEQADWHTFQVLTERSSLQRDYVNRRYPSTPVASHIWLWVGVENRQTRSGMKHLRDTNGSVRPTLPADESRMGSPSKRRVCRAELPFFFKQGGSTAWMGSDALRAITDGCWMVEVDTCS